MMYWIISKDDARRLNVTAFRHGGENGYVVTSGDLASAPRSVREAAQPVTEREALEFIKTLKK